MSTHHIDHPTLGLITVTERRGSRRLTARWVGGQLRVNIPAGVTRRQIDEAIERHSADFERIRPRPLYSLGTQIPIITTPSGDCKPGHPDSLSASASHDSPDCLTVSILPTTHHSDLTLTAGSGGFHILIPEATDIASTATQLRIDNCVKTIGRKLAPAILLPRARQIADRLGLRVDSWEIAHGRNVLGTCYPRQRRIRLSYLNVFLTPELRDYIIHHELAHLTEPGHTAAFHALCDRYCSGDERRLIRLLHAYHWPVQR